MCARGDDVPTADLHAYYCCASLAVILASAQTSQKTLWDVRTPIRFHLNQGDTGFTDYEHWARLPLVYFTSFVFHAFSFPQRWSVGHYRWSVGPCNCWGDGRRATGDGPPFGIFSPLTVPANELKMCHLFHVLTPG